MLKQQYFISFKNVHCQSLLSKGKPNATAYLQTNHLFASRNTPRVRRLWNCQWRQGFICQPGPHGHTVVGLAQSIIPSQKALWILKVLLHTDRTLRAIVAEQTLYTRIYTQCVIMMTLNNTLIKDIRFTVTYWIIVNKPWYLYINIM